MEKEIELRKYHILENSNIVKAILILSLPVMFSNLLRSVHDLVDMFFVSKPLGDDAVAAISITWPIIFFTLSFGIGISVAGTAIISQYIGSKNEIDARHTAGQLLIISVLLGGLLTVLLYTLSPLIITWMGAEGDVYSQAVGYIRIRAFEMIPVFMFMSYQSTRMATGDTKSPMYLLTAAVVINIILSPILISVVGLGVNGAAFATLIANILIAPVGLYFLFFDKKAEIHITKDALIPRPKIVFDLIRMGIPASAAQSLTSIGFVILNAVILSYGEVTVAAFGIGNRISSLIMMPVMGIGGILGTFIGQNVGAFNVDRARKIFKTALIMSVLTMAVGATVLIPVRGFVLSFFFERGSESYLLAVDYMLFLLLGLPLMGIFQTFLGTFNGTGNTHFSLLLSVTRLWLLRLPLVWILSRYTGLGSSGIWYAMLTSNVVAALIGYLLYLRVDFLPKVEVNSDEQTEFEYSIT